MKTGFGNYPYFSCIYSNWLLRTIVDDSGGAGRWKWCPWRRRRWRNYRSSRGTSRSGYSCRRCARARPGLLIGDQLQGQEQINSNQAELDRQRGEFERVKKGPNISLKNSAISAGRNRTSNLKRKNVWICWQDSEG